MLFLIRINMPSQQSHRLTTQRTRPQGTSVSKGHSSLGSSWWDVKFTGVLLRTNWGYASKTPNYTVVSLQNTGAERGLGARIFFKWGNQGPEKERDFPRSPDMWYPNCDKNAALDSALHCPPWGHSLHPWGSGSQTQDTKESPRELIKNLHSQDIPLSDSQS